MRSSNGAARPLLLVVLGLSVAVAAGSLWYLAVSGGGPGGDEASDGADEDEGEDGAGGDAVPLGTGPRGRGGRPRTGSEADDPDVDPNLREWVDEDHLPAGDVFTVDDESLRKAFTAKQWEEVRRQIDIFQEERKPLPADVVDALLRMLRADETRIDAILVLGGVKDDATGLLLARLATEPGADVGTRAAALDALAKSGQAAGLSLVRTIVENPAMAEGEDRVLRHALKALGAMGGDGVDVLLRALDSHRGGDLEDAIVTALAKSRGADNLLATRMRSAKDAADGAGMETILRVLSQTGRDGGPESRTEVTRIIENPAFLEADQETQDRIFQSALSVGASMGGEAYEAVVRTALDSDGTRRAMAMYALRQGRGDSSAQILVTQITPSRWAAADAATRWNIVNALGATESPKVTELLLRALEDEEASVRDAAAAALGQVRDPASVAPMLTKLEKSLDNYNLSRTLVNAIGRTCSKTAEKRLTALLEREFPQRDDLAPFVRLALYRIDTGNPDATLLK